MYVLCIFMYVCVLVQIFLVQINLNLFCDYPCLNFFLSSFLFSYNLFLFFYTKVISQFDYFGSVDIFLYVLISINFLTLFLNLLTQILFLIFLLIYLQIFNLCLTFNALQSLRVQPKVTGFNFRVGRKRLYQRTNGSSFGWTFVSN